MANPYADSVYAQPGLTQMVRQYDRNPGRFDSILPVTSSPSAKAVAAENASLALAYDEINYRNAQGNIVKTLVPSKVREGLTSHGDAFRNSFDSASINRKYTG